MNLKGGAKVKKSIKGWAVFALAAATVFSMGFSSYAASKSDTKIERVKLTLEWDGEPEAGEDAGSISAKIKDSANYTVSDCNYDDKDDETWKRGETPVVVVELEANDGYRFYSTSKSKFDISGCHGEFKSAKISNSGDSLEVKIKLRKVSGDVEEVDDLYWENRTAVWEDLEDGDQYEVKLYRNSSNIDTVTTKENRYNFSAQMTKAGNYTFKVRTVNNLDNKKSSWSSLSEECYVDANSVYTGSSSSAHGTGWIQDQTGWWYRKADGNSLKNSWLYVDNNWFYLGASGYMMSDWIFVDNNWFYLNPVSDGTRGAMKTGWQSINGYWYYLNPISDGTRGARKTSYQLINGNWYFLDLNSGAMWANRLAPNGKWINEAGIIY